MAYYSSNYYDDSYVGESYQNPYYEHCDVVPSQAFLAHSSHEFCNENFFGCNLAPYYGDYDPAMNRSVVAYYVSTYSEPKSIVYDVYNGSYSPEIVTQFRVSHSASVLNDLDFEEYDPTPYDGGYDQAQTYGKPLPPSEAICYPRSTTLDSSTPPLNGFTNGNENPSESASKPYIESIETSANNDEHQQVHDSTEDQLIEYKNNGQDNNPPGSDHGSVYDEDNNYEFKKMVPQIPGGYGFEALDLCDSIFGYWPCLAKYEKRGQDCQQVADYGENNSNQWKETADYLFGTSHSYEENVEYEENSWIYNIF